MKDHEKISKVKWAVTAITMLLLFVLLIGVAMQAFFPEGKRPSDWFEERPGIENPDDENPDDETPDDEPPIIHEGEEYVIQMNGENVESYDFFLNTEYTFEVYDGAELLNYDDYTVKVTPSLEPVGGTVELPNFICKDEEGQVYIYVGWRDLTPGFTIEKTATGFSFKAEHDLEGIIAAIEPGHTFTEVPVAADSGIEFFSMVITYGDAEVKFNFELKT